MIARAANATIKAMNRNHIPGALLLAAASLLATGAYAQNPHASPEGKANAAKEAPKAAEKTAADKTDKAAAKTDTAADKAQGKADKAEGKAKSAEDRAARKAKEHEEQRAKLKAMLKGPPDDALKQELRRHAERIARLDRIKSVATTEKDNDAVERATKLIAKENERHDKWMSKHVTDTAGGAK